jgi:phosphoribosylformylglycinamidine synthase subunit PurQ / glutaminase
MTSKPKAIVLQAAGSNRDLEGAQALELAGAQAEIVPLAELRDGRKALAGYQIMLVPGGFSYADALGAGKLLALDLNTDLAAQMHAFVDSGKPVIGICNGFQALLKAGLFSEQRSETPKASQKSENLPPTADPPSAPLTSPLTTTLTFNKAGHFECRWVSLAPRSQTCVWTRGLSEGLYCPVAHGEGNFAVADSATLEALAANDQIALVYVQSDGAPARGAYPANPNGSAADIAGICNPAGNVLGLMPHPENHLYPYQHPRWSRGEHGGLGLKLFEQGVIYAAQR